MTDLTQQGREQEQAVIASVLRRPSLYEELSEDLHSDHFGWVGYAEVWQAFANLKTAGMSIDTLTVGDELERMGKLFLFKSHDTSYAGRAGLSALKETGEPNNAATYVANVLDYSAKHKLLLKFQEGVYHAANGRKASDIVHDMTAFMGTLEVGSVDQIIDSKQAVKNAMQETEDASSGKVKTVPTGYLDFDRILGGGSREGKLYIVAGRPGDGKSAILLNFARNAAQAGKKVGFISMEMSTTEQINRLIAQLSGIDSQKVEQGKFTDDDWPSYYHAVEVAGDLPIYWDDEPSLTLSQLRSKVRRMASMGLDLLIVDSLNTMVSDMPHAKVFEQINALAYGLKKLAREMKIPIWVAHHTSKEGEKLQREPILADLEQAGEKPADLVAFVFQPKDDILGNRRRLKIAKQRSGPVGSVDLMFNAPATRFDNATSHKVSLSEPIQYTD